MRVSWVGRVSFHQANGPRLDVHDRVCIDNTDGTRAVKTGHAIGKETARRGLGRGERLGVGMIILEFRHVWNS